MKTRQESFAAFVPDQLDGLDGISARPMFGGHGLYREAVFFGIIESPRRLREWALCAAAATGGAE